MCVSLRGAELRAYLTLKDELVAGKHIKQLVASRPSFLILGGDKVVCIIPTGLF